MANLGSVTTNFFPIASETYSNNINTTIGAGASTVYVNSASAYTDGDVVVLTVDPGLTAQATFTGVKASSPDRFTNCFWTEGNVGVGHSTGAVITDYDSATHKNLQTKGMLQEHTQGGTHKNVTATSVTTTGAVTAGTDVVDNGVNSRIFRTQAFSNFVQSGGVWSQVSGLNGTMTALIGYVNGYGISLTTVATRAFTVSKDTYVDILMTGATPSLVYTEVANNAASPALADNSIRLAKVVTSGAAITSITQLGKDSLGNLIYPKGSIGGDNIQSYKVQRRNNTVNIVEDNAIIQSGWVAIALATTSNASATVTFPIPFKNVPIVMATYGGDTAGATSTLGSGAATVSAAYAQARSVTTTTVILTATAPTSGWTTGNTVYVHWIAIGV